MARNRQELRDLSTAEIRQVFVEMGLGSKTKREKMLHTGSLISEQGEKPIVWIDTSTDTATCQFPPGEESAELE